MTPKGPTITENMGDKAQNRTYQDLLKNITDENNFEQLSRSKLIKVSLKGKISQWLDEKCIDRFLFLLTVNTFLLIL